jgi:hypothetical protein
MKVNPSYAGFEFQNVNRATDESQREAFKQRGFRVLLRVLETGLNQSVVPYLLDDSDFRDVGVLPPGSESEAGESDTVASDLRLSFERERTIGEKTEKARMLQEAIAAGGDARDRGLSVSFRDGFVEIEDGEIEESEDDSGGGLFMSADDSPETETEVEKDLSEGDIQRAFEIAGNSYDPRDAETAVVLSYPYGGVPVNAEAGTAAWERLFEDMIDRGASAVLDLKSNMGGADLRAYPDRLPSDHDPHVAVFGLSAGTVRTLVELHPDVENSLRVREADSGDLLDGGGDSGRETDASDGGGSGNSRSGSGPADPDRTGTTALSLTKSERYRLEQDLFRAFETQIMPASVEDIEKEVWTDSEAVPDYVREAITQAIDDGAVFDRFESMEREVGETFHDIRERIEGLLGDTLTQPQGWSLDSIRDDLREEFPSLSEGQAETVARSETASVLNNAREEGYEERDDSHEYYYKWVGPDDSRTTEACERLKNLTNPDYGGTPVDMSELVRMERRISNEEFPELEFRKHMIHINERHTFRRVLPHELDRLDEVSMAVDSPEETEVGDADGEDSPEAEAVEKDLPESVFEDISEDRFIPPEGAAEEVRQALEWIDEYGRDEAEGATQEGIARGRQLLRHVEENEPLTGTNEEGTPYVVEIANWFARHAEDRDIAEEYEGTPWRDNGYLSWLLWGGDPAESWASSLKERLTEIGYLKSCEDHISPEVYRGLIETVSAVAKDRSRREREVEEAVGESIPRLLNRLLGQHGGRKRPAMRQLNTLLDEAGVERKMSSKTFYSWTEKYCLDRRDYAGYA